MAKAKKNNFIGPGLSFSASESYKLLRANIDFCVPDEGQCRVIGINSALKGEGKSTTAMNLGYVVAETGKKVLLIEADMRIPSICNFIGIPKTAGLSNVLAGLALVEDCIKPSGFFDNFRVLPAGDIPPNPTELLGSKKLDNVIDKLKRSFDYIIFDMPPINEVSDSLVISRFLDGMLLVVRQDYCFREALSEAMYQIELSGVNLIGFVMSATTSITRYSKKYSRGNRRYGYRRGTYGYADRQKTDDALFKSNVISPEETAVENKPQGVCDSMNISDETSTFGNTNRRPDKI